MPILDGSRMIHAKWLLHRDIKPDNIYIREDGSPLLIDFGTARHALSVRQGGMTEYLTPGFAPPEQYDRHADHGPWTDIYAVRETMYYCVTRITPVEGRFRSIDNDPVMPAEQAAPKFYDEYLWKVIDWMMSPGVKDRPQSVDEVLERLQAQEDGGAGAIDEGRQELVTTILRGTEPEEAPQDESGDVAGDEVGAVQDNAAGPVESGKLDGEYDDAEVRGKQPEEPILSGAGEASSEGFVEQRNERPVERLLNSAAATDPVKPEKLDAEAEPAATEPAPSI